MRPMRRQGSRWRPNQRDDATLSTVPACHLFACADERFCCPTKEMMQPCPLYLHFISLVKAPGGLCRLPDETASSGTQLGQRDDATLSKSPACHLFGSASRIVGLCADSESAGFGREEAMGDCGSFEMVHGLQSQRGLMGDCGSFC